MKKTLYDVFDEATPSELDLLSEQMEASELQHEMLASVKSKVYAKTQPVHVHNKKGRIIAMKKNSTRIYKCLLASAVCLAMVLGCFAGYYAFLKQPSPAHSDPVPPPTTAPAENQAVVTTVTLDINPSIEITADKEERVLKVSALNKDAEIVMGDMALEGTSLELTVNALVGSMLQKGYLNEKTNTVLLSVDSKDEADGNAIKEKLSEKISLLVDTESINGSVISQTVSADDQELSDLASQYKMTLGKAKLIRTIVNMNPGSDFADYAELTVTELNAVMNQSAEDPKDESIYIGKEKALEIALNWRKVSADDLVCEPTIELVASRGKICYLIDVRTHSAVYIVYVDAFTGGISSEGVNEPNFTAEEAWSFVCDQLGSEAEKATLLKQEFNDHTVSNFPMTYLFRFEIGDIEYAALVDALNGTVIRITKI